jgi:hypothetical protein
MRGPALVGGVVRALALFRRMSAAQPLARRGERALGLFRQKSNGTGRIGSNRMHLDKARPTPSIFSHHK